MLLYYGPLFVKRVHAVSQLVRADKGRKAKHDRSHDTDNLVGKRASPVLRKNV